MERFDYLTPDGRIVQSACKTRRELLNKVLGSSDRFADEMEYVARVLKHHGEITPEESKQLFSLAWRLKQVNRVGTASEGI